MKRIIPVLLYTLTYFIGHAQSTSDTTTGATIVTDTSSLPVQQFSVIEKDKKALLRWRADSLSSSDNFFAVERSGNGIDFNLVGITKGNTGGWIEFMDESPPKGKVFYRLKLNSGQSTVYSVHLAGAGLADVSCKFYPNPVDKVLIVRSESAVELLISDQNGKPLISDKSPAGLKVVDVSALEPGVYVITLFQKETGRQLTDKLVKK